MDTTNAGKGGANLGIVETTVLSPEYANSLFASDPEDITPVGKLKAEDKVDDGPVTSQFIEDDEDIIAGIDNEPKKKRRDDSQKPVKQVEGEEDEESDEEESDPEEDLEEDQPEKKPKKKKAQKQETEEESEEETSTGEFDNIIPAFARELFEIGMFSLDEDEQDVPTLSSPQELAERFKYEKRKGAVEILENIVSQYGDEYGEAFETIFVKGVHPRDYYGHMERMSNLSNLDLSIVDNQRGVLKHYYETITGLDPNKASAKVERMFERGDLEDESKDALQILLNREEKELKDKEESKRHELMTKARQEQEFQVAVQKILGDKMKAGEFDGIPVDERLIRDTAGFLLEKRWQMKDGRQISDFEKDLFDLDRPENRETKVKVALLLQLMKVDPTLSRLQKKILSKETNDIFKSLQREKVTAKKQGKKTTNFFDD